MADFDPFPADDVSGADAATLAGFVAASLAARGRVRPERIKVMLSSDRRREHPPELRSRLVSEMMAGAAVSTLWRRRHSRPDPWRSWTWCWKGRLAAAGGVRQHR